MIYFQCVVEIETTGTQFDPSLISTSVSTSMDIEYATTGIQPEVSFIMQLMDEDADKSESSSDEDSGKYVGEFYSSNVFLIGGRFEWTVTLIGELL